MLVAVLIILFHLSWIPWNLSFRYILFHEKRLQKMLWHLNARVNSHQRWKQTWFRVCFHLWCELTSTMNVTEWHVSWNTCSSYDDIPVASNRSLFPQEDTSVYQQNPMVNHSQKVTKMQGVKIYMTHNCWLVCHLEVSVKTLFIYDSSGWPLA